MGTEKDISEIEPYSVGMSWSYAEIKQNGIEPMADFSDRLRDIFYKQAIIGKKSIIEIMKYDNPFGSPDELISALYTMCKSGEIVYKDGEFSLSNKDQK